MGKDFWGGMFDFNGDGKTIWDEEILGLSLLEEDRKRTLKIQNPSHHTNIRRQKQKVCLQ